MSGGRHSIGTTFINCLMNGYGNVANEKSVLFI